MTDRYAVFGNPIGHSKSPRIHAMFAAQTGQDISYEAILVETGSFAAAVNAFIATGTGPARGANVTVPFKEEAFRLATRRTPRAEAAGAVNTLNFDAGTILGDNTDGAGLVRDLKNNLGCDPAGRRILLLGAGGAARGVIAPLCAEGPRQLLIANRSVDKARAVAAEFSVAGCGLIELEGQCFDLVINATSAGLSGESLALPAGLFAQGSLAYDMVYGRETAFMIQARAGGASLVADGLGMLVEQAAESFLLWRGLRPDTAPVLCELRAIVGKR